MRDQSFTDAAIRLFWHRAPRAVGRISPTLGWMLLGDRYLLAWPRLAAYAPTAALALGVLTGLVHPGAVYSGSLLVLFLLVVVGAAGPSTGLWFLAGFLPMDLLVRPGAWSGQISHFGLLVADLVLVLLLVLIAASTVRLRRQLTLWWLGRRAQGAPPAPESESGSPSLEIVGSALVYMMLTWAWLESVPVFIRPVFTWAGTIPDTGVVSPVQTNTVLLTIVAGLAAGAVAAVGLRAVALAVTPGPPDRDPRELPAWAGIPLLAALGVLIAAGLLSGPWDALALFAVLVLGQIAQRRVGRSARWFGQVRRLPDAVRLLAVLVVTAVVGLLVVAPVFAGSSGLWPVLLVTVLGLALTAVAMPQRERSALEEEPE